MNDNVMRSFVDLRRNFAVYPFESTMLESDRHELTNRVISALDEQEETWILYTAGDLDSKAKMTLEDIDLVESVWLQNKAVSLLIRNDHSALVCLHEQDHVLIRVAADPRDSLPAIRMAKGIAKLLSETSAFAKDERIGWLTAKPQYAGTGIQISFMLHLPMLVMMQQIKAVEQKTNASHGFFLRGCGPEENNPGSLYCLSNLFTAYSSSELLSNAVKRAAEEICGKEENLRKKVLKYATRSIYLDQIYRAWGILLYARRLTQAEFLTYWSKARLGACAGLLPTDIYSIDTLLDLTSKSKLIEQTDGVLDEHAIHFNRADTVRAALHGGT